MTPAFVLTDLASELALFAAAGFLLFAIDDLVVDLIYFARRAWRALTVYRRYPRAFADSLPAPEAGAIKTTKPRKGCDVDGNPLDLNHPWRSHQVKGVV